MGYLKMQGGEWLVTGRCSSPKFRRVGKNHTPFCTVGIAAGTNPKELDEQGRPGSPSGSTSPLGAGQQSCWPRPTAGMQ